MEVIDITCVAVGVLGVLFGLKCYRELFKWARQCQNARIVIAYKRRVQLQAPLVEWLLWTNTLDKDKASQGRVVYSRSGVTVAIAKAVKPPGRVRKAIQGTRARRGQAAPTVREGSWTAQDQTPSVDKVREELKR